MGVVEIVPGYPALSLQPLSQVCVAYNHSALHQPVPQRYGGMYTFEQKMLTRKLTKPEPLSYAKLLLLLPLPLLLLLSLLLPLLLLLLLPAPLLCHPAGSASVESPPHKLVILSEVVRAFANHAVEGPAVALAVACSYPHPVRYCEITIGISHRPLTTRTGPAVLLIVCSVRLALIRLYPSDHRYAVRDIPSRTSL
jgi:hypothetical protein